MFLQSSVARATHPYSGVNKVVFRGVLGGGENPNIFRMPFRQNSNMFSWLSWLSFVEVRCTFQARTGWHHASHPNHLSLRGLQKQLSEVILEHASIYLSSNTYTCVPCAHTTYVHSYGTHCGPFKPRRAMKAAMSSKVGTSRRPNWLCLYIFVALLHATIDY